jgi:uncharacterized protein involved in exopolysaccharide biosynthesis
VEPEGPLARSSDQSADPTRSAATQRAGNGSGIRTSAVPVGFPEGRSGGGTPLNAATEHEWLFLDMGTLRAVLQRRARQLVAGGLILTLTLMMLFLFLFPRKFEATVSLALQGGMLAPGGGGSGGLSALLGGTSKEYRGVILSRRFAAQAARAVNIQKTYGQTSFEDAVLLVEQSISVEDQRDGLLYIRASLPGPPRLGSGERERVVKETVRNLANAYLKIFERYLEGSNTDRDAALIRQAQTQLDGARQEYERSVRRLVSAVGSAARGKDTVVDALAVGGGTASTAGAGGGSGDNGGSASSVAAGELQTLYLARGQVEQKLRASEAAQTATEQLIDGGVADTLPGEDPLLAEARQRLSDARVQWENLRITLADTHPDVVAAKKRMDLAADRLRRQSEAVRTGRTSRAAEMAGMRTEYETLNRQIADAERRLKIGLNASTSMGLLRNEVMLRLEVLKQAATAFAQLQVQAVAGDNLMDVIDEAELPRYGSPGFLMIGAMSVVGAITLLSLLVLAETALLMLRQRRRESNNGSSDGLPAPAVTASGLGKL